MRPAKTIVRTFVLSLTVATTAPAQVTFNTTGRELKDAVMDVFYIWTSPLRAKPRDVIGAIGVTAGAVALWPEDDQIDSWIVRHPNAAVVRAFTPWDENHPTIGDLSTGQRLLPISVALIIPGMIADNRKLREAGWGCLSGWQASSTIRQVMYATISRERPSLNNGNQYAIKTPGGEWDYHSFFAGHTANAWACTTFWNTRFHMGLLEPVLYAGAAGITFSRMKDRRHWASDTWVGIAAGYAMGRTVAGRYARREAKREQKTKPEPIRAGLLEGLQIAPMRGGLALGWSGTFGGPAPR
jgi:hypothetical protein